LWDPMKDRAVDYMRFKEEYGLEPRQWIDVMALSGDASDNIPGVPGIGEKTALKLIQEFENINALLSQTDKVKQKKPKEALAQHADQAILSYKLASIHTKVPLDQDIDLYRVKPSDRDMLGNLFRDLEFKELQKKYSAGLDASVKSYLTILDQEGLAALAEELKKAGSFSLDLETTSVDPMRAEIVGLSFAFRPNEAFYIPCGHSYPSAPSQLGLNIVLDMLRPLLEESSLKKTGQNIKYDAIILNRHGINIQGIAFDTMIASYLLNPSIRSHSLEAIAQEILDYKMITYKEVTGQGKNALRFDQVPIEEATRYSCEDADITLITSHTLSEKLNKKGLAPLFYEVEIPLVSVLIDMEMTGVLVDQDQLAGLSKEFETELVRLEENIFEIAGEKFNINSHQQLGKILFEKLGLPCKKKTKKKTGYSTDLEVLESLSGKHELPAYLLRYRSIAKLKSTYTDAIQGLIHPETKRVHTSYNQAVTATGRLSSSDPNLQNIPIRTEEGKKIRQAFIPRQGWKMLCADYSQIELRVLAHYSKDPLLLKAFEADADIHTRTAAEVFQLFPEYITPEMRRQAKVINFGIIYGMSPFGLSKELGISTSTAKKYIDSYFNQYKGVKEYIDKTIETARKEGLVTTLLNRHRYLPDILSPNKIAREAAERTAVNTPIQGTSADLIKLAMIRLYDHLKLKRFQAKIVLQVHDELVFESPPDELSDLKAVVKKIMEEVYPMRVPIKVELGEGDNWAEAH
ncbi:MAG: DNA polymerase I, partial [Pseudomonadota bacterium]